MADETDREPGIEPMIFVTGRTAAAMNSRATNSAGPLRRIVGATGGPYQAPWELLECGHRGRRQWSEHAVQALVERGKRRRCRACGQAT